eukprot:gnl/TRDRNA2_/TRDRNA2_36407_c0_seq1.p1 gnl/TRDRNA2_/TRDRNA2_36407_c0~~gnl/TRDRNA2_/TRDRNA2_36407_c0_seq1.p1  ORF type:complete len:313 (-),score=39.15 gnl/TRDRNA2_/TRDRNA2_36407_c0_seq1:86-1024(-)
MLKEKAFFQEQLAGAERTFERSRAQRAKELERVHGWLEQAGFPLLPSHFPVLTDLAKIMEQEDSRSKSRSQTGSPKADGSKSPRRTPSRRTKSHRLSSRASVTSRGSSHAVRAGTSQSGLYTPVLQSSPFSRTDADEPRSGGAVSAPPMAMQPASQWKATGRQRSRSVQHAQILGVLRENQGDTEASAPPRPCSVAGQSRDWSRQISMESDMSLPLPVLRENIAAHCLQIEVPQPPHSTVGQRPRPFTGDASSAFAMSARGAPRDPSRLFAAMSARGPQRQELCILAASNRIVRDPGGPSQYWVLPHGSGES